jgi:hypothetical protein
MKKNLKKISFFILIIANIFFVNISFIYAFDSFSLSNPVGVENSILGDLGVNKDELRYNIQNMNVSRQKMNPPHLMLTFEPTNPVPGQKVTVTATPTYFMNDTKNLYFTWYLKNAKCTDKTSDGDNYKYNSDCDFNDDGKVNIEDYKIKAMRMIASNDFDYANNAYDKQTTSNNGYKASGGGDDQKGKSTHCYFHDTATGNEYEIDQANCGSSQNGHLFAQPPSNGSYHATGSGTFSIDDEKFWHTNPNADDTAGTGNNDGANVAGLGENTFTFNYAQGDKVGVVVEGISSVPTQYSDASYKTMWAFTKNTCNNLKTGLSSKYPISNSNTVTTVDSPIANCTTTATTTTVEDIFGTQINNFANIRTYTTIETKISCIDPITGLATEIPSGYQADTITRSATCQKSDTESGGAGSVTYNNNAYTCSGVIDGTDSQASQGDISISDLNKCLYENLITPSEGGGAKQKINVNISYSPQNPINDNTDGGDNGDQLIFNSTVSGAQNPDYLNYTWQVYKGDAADTEKWTILTKTDIPNATQMTGLGVNSFKFKLNFTGDNIPKFLKVKLVVKDSVAEGETQEGHTDTIVAVSSSGERLKIFPVIITYPSSTQTDKPTVKFDDSSNDNELCLTSNNGNKEPTAVCSVTKNDILGVKIENSGTDKYTDFLWTIDNLPLTCPSSNLDGCISDNQTNTNKIYLPILKNVGEQFTLGFSATKANGEKLSLTRVFKVIEPKVSILPMENGKDASGGKIVVCRGKLLGKYADLQGNLWDDRSDTDFNALTGYNIVLMPIISGVDFAQMSDANYQWIVDGSVITKNNVTEYGGYALDTKTGTLTLPPKNEGESYIVGFSVPYTQKNAKKQALNQYWNVSYTDFYEKKLSSQVQIKMVSLSSQLAKIDPTQKKILATISSGIPSYISFLFRIVLSGFALIVVIKVLIYVLPRTKNFYEE